MKTLAVLLIYFVLLLDCCLCVLLSYLLLSLYNHIMYIYVEVKKAQELSLATVE